MKGGDIVKMIEIEYEHYKMLVKELEILHCVGEVILAYEKQGYSAKETLDLVTKIVFKEYDFIYKNDLN